MKQNIEERILDALRHEEKSGLRLADELFVSRETADSALRLMVKSGLLFRRFKHNRHKNRPDYIYSTVKARKPDRNCADIAVQLVGDIDAIDFSKVRE